ncbi:tail tape measure protein [Qipengyuania psychrotolerans]|uniref:Tail tape measure protein n=1 Tax=Qipengyuania psychrotolerans TaxID=2867238 RepID=A0ABX8ZGB3_9SPHN|nr:tail tape measure protein [Qipengyuania psychrotolerans]QZD87184.1 tail tape measure protein [Qipengyuania psychrotolerans]
MNDDFEELVVSVRADTAGFAQDVAQMKREFDTNLVDGFDAAGKVLESGLTRALRNGKLGFEDLKRMALQVMDQIASKALGAGIDAMFAGLGKGGAGGGAGASLLSGLLSSGLGLPGRATGGSVAPDRPYLVGERGPELFVPTSAGSVEPNHRLNGSRTDVRVAINLAQPRGASTPASLQRSSRQVASAVRRALSN